MGDRGSITVFDGTDMKYPVLFRHWEGSPESMKKLCERTKTEFVGRFIGGDVVIARMTKLAVDEDGNSSYLGIDEHSGDNSDNGHYVLDISEDDWVLKHGNEELMHLPEERRSPEPDESESREDAEVLESERTPSTIDGTATRYRCSHCFGQVEWGGKGRGWRHAPATGCIRAAVSKSDWKKHLQSQRQLAGDGSTTPGDAI
jgi:hypothetical protein